MFVIATVALTAIVGIGLNVLLGLTGQVSFGHVGFYAIGAYAVAILTTGMGWSFWLAWPAAALIAGAFGALLALPALRVKGPYLAMVTIAFGFIVEHAIVEMRGLTGGQNGIMGMTAPSLGVDLGGERGVALLALFAAALLLAAYARLARGTWGAAMRAVRDSETAAESIGLNPLVIKTVAFAVSAMLAGLAGGLFAPLSGFVTPDSFGFMQSILFVLVVVVAAPAPRRGRWSARWWSACCRSCCRRWRNTACCFSAACCCWCCGLRRTASSARCASCCSACSRRQRRPPGGAALPALTAAGDGSARRWPRTSSA